MNLINFECFDSGNTDVDEWSVLMQAWLEDTEARQNEVDDGLIGGNTTV